MATLSFDYDGSRYEIALRPDLAPVAIGKLLATLPVAIDIHCAKIAGSHIFWHAPFLAELEAATDIMTLPPGTFLYWPERQFLELIYGELQAETAAVSVLGRLRGDVGWLKALGARVLERQGHETVWARLAATGASSPGRNAPVSPALLPLVEARRAAWDAMPAELTALSERRGIMMPYGPLAMAEGEFRKLQELLWRLRPAGAAAAPADRAGVAAFLVDAFIARIDGFCGLHEAGRVLREGRTLLTQPACSDAAIEELILYTGRMAAWLDLCIPWSDLNAAVLDASGRAPAS